MIVDFINYFRGYVRICVQGVSAERFINACRYRGIELKNIHVVHNTYYMDLSLEDYKSIRPIVRKTKAKTKIVKRKGFPFMYSLMKKRYYFLGGIFLFFFLNIWLSSFLWNIDIKGNQMETKEVLLDYLRSKQIYVGMKHKAIDCAWVEKEIRKSFDDIIWVSASTKGSCLFIQVKENENKKYEKDTKNDGIIDIVADCDAYIEAMIVRRGIAMVLPGTNVKKGDTLVSGSVPVFNDEKEIVRYQHKNADADIIGITQIQYQDHVSGKKVQKKYYAIEREIYEIIIGKYIFTFGLKKNQYTCYEKHTVSCDFLFRKQWKLPIYARKIILKPYQTKESMYSEKEIQSILTDRYYRYEKELEKKGVEIIKNNVKINRGLKDATASGTIKIKRKIGITKKRTTE